MFGIVGKCRNLYEAGPKGRKLSHLSSAPEGLMSGSQPLPPSLFHSEAQWCAELTCLLHCGLLSWCPALLPQAQSQQYQTTTG